MISLTISSQSLGSAFRITTLSVALSDSIMEMGCRMLKLAIRSENIFKRGGEINIWPIVNYGIGPVHDNNQESLCYPTWGWGLGESRRERQREREGQKACK